MDKNAIIHTIQSQTLQLDRWDKVKYFKVPAICIFAGLMSISNGFQTFDEVDFSEVSTKCGLIFIAAGITSYILKSNRLRMKVVPKPDEGSIKNLLAHASKMKWVTELKTDQALIFKTVPIRGYHEATDLYHNKDTGQRIYIFYDRNKAYVKSIDNLDNPAFKIHRGENLENERFVVKMLESSRSTKTGD